MRDPADIRRLFPAASAAVLFDNASEGPLALPVAQAIESFAGDLARIPVQLRDPAAAARAALERVGALLGASADRLAWVQTTTAGLVALARGLPLEAGSVVAIPDNEYPAVVVPWLERASRRGDVRVELLPVTPAVAGGTPLDQIEATLARPEVKVLSLSAVGWLGHCYRIADIAEACRRHGVVFAVDGSQATGMIDLALDDLGVDFFVTTFCKWAFGPEGIACVYLSDPLRLRLQPTVVNIESLALDQDHLLDYGLPFPTPPAPLVLAYPPPILVAGLRAGIDLALEIGVAAIERRVLELAGCVHDTLPALGYQVQSDPEPRHRSGIVTFSHPNRARNRPIADALRADGIHLRLREGLLRVSMHAYTTADDLTRLHEALRDLRD